MTPKFLVSRLAGRDASFKYDRASKHMSVDIAQSPLRRMIGEVFGDDEMDKQFTKMLKDFGTDPQTIMNGTPPPAATLGQDNGKVTLSWSPPRTKPSKLETRYLETARRVLAEAETARQGGPDTIKQFFATLKKALDDLLELAKAVPVGPRRMPTLGATPRQGGMHKPGLMQAPRRPDGRLDVASVPPGASFWALVSNPTSPHAGETVLVKRRADGRFELLETRSLEADLDALVTV
jgi:hypothetical protein